MKIFPHQKWIIFTTLIVILPLRLVFAQEENENLDDLFLDDSFMTESEESEKVEPFFTTPSEPSVALSFDMRNEYVYNIIQPNYTNLNPDKILYNSPWTNLLFLDSAIRYRNAERWFSLDLRNRTVARIRESDDDSLSLKVETAVRNELVSAKIGVNLFQDRLSFSLGKILTSNSTSFIRQPSNPLFRSYGQYTAWATNKEFKDIKTRDGLSASPEEIGLGDSLSLESSEKRIGNWMFQASLNLPWFTLLQSYLPRINSGKEEVDRPNHSYMAVLTSDAIPQVTPTITFFYDRLPFFGLGISSVIGDHLTLHFDGALSFENKLPMPRSDGTVPLSQTVSANHYKITPYSTDGEYFEGVIGATLTPTYQGSSLFSILFEAYYNGKGLKNKEWDEYRDILGDVHSDYENEQMKPLRNLYKGFLGLTAQSYEPLFVRPLYLVLRISRQDIFQKSWTERLDLTSTLVYSPFDTTFVWKTSTEWVGKRYGKLGLAFNYYFGQKGGAFTEIPNAIQLVVYGALSFSRQ